MENKIEKKSEDNLRKKWDLLKDAEKKAFAKIISHKTISRDTHSEYQDSRTFGERVADNVASFGGSWTFIIIFGIVLLGWVILNSFILLNRAFDPYPYILLNLFLSMLASIQAPIIMMSQNRHAAKDRLDAQHDYEVNLKAELEICTLHEKLDDLREKKWLDLIELQQKQIQILEMLLKEKKTDLSDKY